MMLAYPVGMVLLSLAALHVAWAIGFWWPIRNEAALANAVFGLRGATRMPGAAPTSVVAVALIWAAAWPFLGDAVPPGIHRAGLLFLTFVFFVRGFAAFIPAWRRVFSEQPFASLDRQLYGPLCLAVGAAFLMIERSM